MRYDVHTHAWPEAIAGKVLTQLNTHYGIEPKGTGTVDDLLARAARAGLDRIVAHCAATAAAQVIPANNWAMDLQRQHPEILAFGTLHPDFADWEAELYRLKAAGIRGLKFHPEFQGFWLDAPGLLPIMEAAVPDFVFMFHVGDRPLPAENPSCPFKVAALAKRFPKARIIAAHLGGYLHWEWVMETLVGRDVYLDTSSTLAFIGQDLLERIFHGHPRERLLFGSDYPLFDPGEEMGHLQRRLGLTDREVEALQENAAALFEV